jgi:dipeptidyl aminopeptidase/acylaminoacyl peptidase
MLRRLSPASPLVLAALLAGTPLAAQQPRGRFDLSVASIMRGPELYGREPQQVRWSADGRWIYFMWNEPGTAWQEPLAPYRVRALAGSRPERVTRAHMDSVAPLLAGGRRSPDLARRVVSTGGDLWVVDEARGTARRLTQTTAVESDPSFDATGRRVFFIRENDVYSIDLDGGLVRQLTDVRAGPAPRDEARAEGQRAALERQQRELFESVRDRLRADSVGRAERSARDSTRPKPLYLTAGERVTGVSVAPSGRALLITTTIPSDRGRTAIVPAWVTASGYTEELQARTKVGDATAGGRVAWMSLPRGEVRWLTTAPADSTRPPAFATSLGWDDAGTRALVFAQSADFKTRWLHVVSADSGTLRTVDTLRDTAWTDGPCFGCGGWLADGRLWFVSEADGFAHLYTMRADGSERRQLTSGPWEVADVRLSRDRRAFWLTTSETSPFEQHLWRVSVDGGPRTRITTRRGAHDATPSPDEQWLADVFSQANRPPELFLVRARPNAEEMAQLTTSPTAEWLSHPWLHPEIVRVRASDGVEVPARLYRPADVGAQPNGAAVIFVHGSGYLQNVHEWWSSYSREYMFHHLLASRGYVVLDMDYRGSAGYGRDWRTAIYRHMGGRDLQDQVDGARWLGERFGVPPERVGIYGGSYGGFITLMALFTEPRSFGAGAALRAVTDWAHYNHGYTGRILNLPQTDTLAYRQSSPIWFAQGLEDPLLMAHGMVDVNVHFSDIVRLTERLIELGKTGWELAVYPVEDHGFVRPSSWTDEYRRILAHFDRTIGAPRGAATSPGAR